MRSLLSRLDRHLAPSPDPARVGWLRDWSYAHRGLHSDGVPENSLAAFAGAMERGMGIECDIQRSQDHAAILMHDWELDRLTGVSGPTAGYSAEELAQRRAEHRSPLVARCVEDYQSGRRLPLDAIYQHPWPLQRG